MAHTTYICRKALRAASLNSRSVVNAIHSELGLAAHSFWLHSLLWSAFALSRMLLCQKFPFDWTILNQSIHYSLETIVEMMHCMRLPLSTSFSRIHNQPAHSSYSTINTYPSLKELYSLSNHVDHLPNLGSQWPKQFETRERRPQPEREGQRRTQ